MIPTRVHANGLPWLEWIGNRAWECRGCRRAGEMPAFTDVPSFARSMGDLKRSHSGCGPPVAIPEGAIGHPLNPDRAER